MSNHNNHGTRLRHSNHQHRRLLLPIALVCLALFCTLPAMAASETVNVNTADAPTLALLPRVGPAVAQRIIDYREENGSFQKKEELLLVRGIGERTYELIEPFIALDGESTLSEKVRIERPTSEEAGR